MIDQSLLGTFNYRLEPWEFDFVTAAADEIYERSNDGRSRDQVRRSCFYMFLEVLFARKNDLEWTGDGGRTQEEARACHWDCRDPRTGNTYELKREDDRQAFAYDFRKQTNHLRLSVQDGQIDYVVTGQLTVSRDFEFRAVFRQIVDARVLYRETALRVRPNVPTEVGWLNKDYWTESTKDTAVWFFDHTKVHDANVFQRIVT